MDPNKIFGANSEFLSEEVKSTIAEAWTKEMTEVREEIAAEMREEFASRYEHDKAQIIESMDAKLNDAITAELKEFAEDKKALTKDRVAYKRSIKEHAAMLDKFVNSVLVKEVTQLREDRSTQKNDVKKLEEFVLSQLTTELNEFKVDKRKLVEQRIQLLREGKKMIAETKQKFVKNASAKVESMMESVLKNEITTLREDIRVARENEFGRKIVEAFGVEFMTSHMSNGTTVSKQQKSINKLQESLGKLEQKLNESKKAEQAAQRKIRIAEDQASRRDVLAEMMQPLNSEQKSIMGGLLKSVKTARLREAYNKYLPSVLNESKGSRPSNGKKPLNESKRVLTGDKKSKSAVVESKNDQYSADIIELRKLAGVQAGNK